MIDKNNIRALLDSSISELSVSDTSLTEDYSISLIEFYLARDTNPTEELISLLEAGFFSGLADKMNPHRAVRREAPMISVTDRDGHSTKYFAFPDLQVSTQDGPGRPGHDAILNKIVQDEQAKGFKVEKVPTGSIGRLAANKQITQVKMPDNNQKENVIKALYSLGQLVQNKYAQAQAYKFMSNEELEALKQEVTNSFEEIKQAASNEEATTQNSVTNLEQQVDTATQSPSQNTALRNTMRQQYNQKPIQNEGQTSPVSTGSAIAQPVSNMSQFTGQVGAKVSFPFNGTNASGVVVSSTPDSVTVKLDGSAQEVTLPANSLVGGKVQMTPLKPLVSTPTPSGSQTIQPQPVQATSPITSTPGTTAQVNPVTPQTTNQVGQIPTKTFSTQTPPPSRPSDNLVGPNGQPLNSPTRIHRVQDSYNPYTIGKELL